ncbi:uncharacterized protein OGAPODRAFT_75319 [Ogataea polymorpha]|nr:uncharacterized protein OGAPODRAFT_75319 [Ogataea polymorpha]KAG7938187.1 hypothetical protein KL934_000761 [Ogataea polymorpha]OBA17376.1 hypothetical protein OGAPODRAFT_75319 [Ogataea polymorpha]
MEQAMLVNNRRPQNVVDGVPRSSMSQALGDSAFIDVRKEAPLPNNNRAHYASQPGPYYPSPNYQGYQKPHPGAYQVPYQRYDMYMPMQPQVDYYGRPANMAPPKVFGEGASHSRRSSLASNSSSSVNKFFKRGMKFGKDDDDDDGNGDADGDVELEVSASTVSFDDLQHIRGGGRYGNGSSALDTQPYIPTLSSRPRAPNGQLSNVQYRKQMTAQKKMVAAQLANANKGPPRAMSLEAGMMRYPRTMSMQSAGPGYMNPGPRMGYDPRAMSMQTRPPPFNNKFSGPDPSSGNPPKAMSMTSRFPNSPYRVPQGMALQPANHNGKAGSNPSAPNVGPEYPQGSQNMHIPPQMMRSGPGGPLGQQPTPSPYSQQPSTLRQPQPVAQQNIPQQEHSTTLNYSMPGPMQPIGAFESQSQPPFSSAVQATPPVDQNATYIPMQNRQSAQQYTLAEPQSQEKALEGHTSSRPIVSINRASNSPSHQSQHDYDGMPAEVVSSSQKEGEVRPTNEATQIQANSYESLPNDAPAPEPFQPAKKNNRGKLNRYVFADSDDEHDEGPVYQETELHKQLPSDQEPLEKKSEKEEPARMDTAKPRESLSFQRHSNDSRTFVDAGARSSLRSVLSASTHGETRQSSYEKAGSTSGGDPDSSMYSVTSSHESPIKQRVASSQVYQLANTSTTRQDVFTTATELPIEENEQDMEQPKVINDMDDYDTSKNNSYSTFNDFEAPQNVTEQADSSSFDSISKTPDHTVITDDDIENKVKDQGFNSVSSDFTPKENFSEIRDLDNNSVQTTGASMSSDKLISANSSETISPVMKDISTEENKVQDGEDRSNDNSYSTQDRIFAPRDPGEDPSSMDGYETQKSTVAEIPHIPEDSVPLAKAQEETEVPQEHSVPTVRHYKSMLLPVDNEDYAKKRQPTEHRIKEKKDGSDLDLTSNNSSASSKVRSRKPPPQPPAANKSPELETTKKSPFMGFKEAFSRPVSAGNSPKLPNAKHFLKKISRRKRDEDGHTNASNQGDNSYKVIGSSTTSVQNSGYAHNYRGLTINLPSKDSDSTFKNKKLPKTPITPSDSLMNYRLTLNLANEENDYRLSKIIDMDLDEQSFTQNTSLDDINGFNTSTDLEKATPLANSSMTVDVEEEQALGKQIRPSGPSSTEHMNGKLVTPPRSKEEDKFNFTSPESGKTGKISLGEYPEYANYQHMTSNESQHQDQPSNIKSPQYAFQGAKEKSLASPSTTVDARDRQMTPVSQQTDQLTSETAVFKPEQLELFNSNQELFNELQIVSSELADSISREIRLQRKLEVNNIPIEGDVVSEESKIASLTQQLADERRKRFAVEEFLAQQYNKGFDVADLKNKVYNNSDMGYKVFKLTEENNLNKSKYEIMEQENSELKKRLEKLSSENKELIGTTIPKLKNQLEVAQNPVSAATYDSLLKEVEQLKSEKLHLRSQLSSKGNIAELESQKEELREALKNVKAQKEMDLRMCAERIRTLEAKVEKLTLTNERYIQKFGPIVFDE